MYNEALFETSVVYFVQGLSISLSVNKAGYTATPVACGWAGAAFEVTRSFAQEQ